MRVASATVGAPSLHGSRCSRLRSPAATLRAQPRVRAAAARPRLPAAAAAAASPRAARAHSGTHATLRSSPLRAFAACSAAAAALPSAAEAEAAVYTALRRIIDPDFGADIVECGFVKELACDVAAGHVSFVLELTTPVRRAAAMTRAAAAAGACAGA